MASNRYFDSSFLAEQVRLASGQVRGVSSVHKFGAVLEMSIGATGTIWDVNDTLYPWSAWLTPGTLTIPVVNIADDGATLTLTGLDSDFNEITEEIVISSTVPVTTISTFARCYRAWVEGDFDANTGAIEIQRGGTTVARINPNQAQTLMAVYTVPAGYTAYIDRGSCTVQANADAHVDFKTRVPGKTTFLTKHSFEVSGVGGAYHYDFTVPMKLPEKYDLDIRATVRSNNARCTSSFDIILIKN
jgi:hypothetical protein